MRSFRHHPLDRTHENHIFSVMHATTVEYAISISHTQQGATIADDAFLAQPDVLLCV